MVIVLNSYPILELIGTDMKHKIINLKKSGILIMAVFAMVTTLCARPLMAFADGDDTYWPEGPQINSPCAVVMEVNTGTMLYEKNSHEKHYPASITKILTTYLAILNCKMDEKVTFSKEAVKESSDGSSSIKRDVGEEMTMEQTLYGVMLESANECAYAAAEHTGKKLGGDYSTFIDLMNKEAKELGCTDTHFNNANGLPDENTGQAHTIWGLSRVRHIGMTSFERLQAQRPISYHQQTSIPRIPRCTIIMRCCIHLSRIHSL